MTCNLCTENITKINVDNDCILQCLEKIKLHFITLREQLAEKLGVIEDLTNNNSSLVEKINTLSNELLETKQVTDNKRRKTNSFESDNEVSIIENENLCKSGLLSDKSLDELNKAVTIDTDLDETIFGPSQPAKVCARYAETPKLNFHTESNDKLSNKMSTKVHLDIIPQRGKECTYKKENSENKSPVKCSKWKKKTSPRLKGCKGLIDSNWNMSFNQTTQIKPVVIRSTDEEIALSDKSFPKCSPKVNDTKSMKSSLSLRRPIRHGLFRQSKLNFEQKDSRKSDPDETFCDEVTASPTCISLTNEAKMPRPRSLRKFDSKKFENISFDSPPKKSGQETEHETKMSIKSEPISLKKSNSKSVKKSLSPEKTNSEVNTSVDLSGISEIKDSSSLIILSKDNDDLIWIEETDPGFDNIDSMDLLNEMMKPNETSDMLMKIERQRIEQIKVEQAKKNTLKTTEKKQNSNIDERIAPEQRNEASENESQQVATEVKEDPPDEELNLYNCDECKAYAKFLGRHLTKDEVIKRLQSCTNHKKPIVIQETPEDFWNPYFPTTRETTIIDSRFVHKKK